MIEFWRAGIAWPSTSMAEARRVEAEGWDGQMFMDSQSLGIDPYVAMGLWAGATERLKLSPGVTNPYARHLAVTAASIASVQSMSDGRAVLGLGRGDSALAYLGLSPVGVADFRRAIERLQALLRGEEIAFGADEELASSAALSLGAGPEGTKLRWLPEGLPKVPLDVAATGPKVIELAAPVAERVTFSVGAMPERIDWAVGRARAARAAKGLGEDGISYGAQVLVFCHRDRKTALAAAGQSTPPLARFQVIQGKAAGPMSENDRKNLEAIRTSYDMTTHGVQHAKDRLMGMTLDPEFVARFAIAGTPEDCAARLVDLAARGLSRFVCVGPSYYPESWGEDRDLFVREVMPAVRASVETSLP